MHGRKTQNKYTFLHKVVYKRIAFTHSYLKVCIRTGKDASVKKCKWCTNVREYIQAKVLLSL